MNRFLAAAAAAVISACASSAGPQGPEGPAGPTGPQGPAGARGPALLTRTTPEAAGTRCPTGGVVLDFGLDANGDGTLATTEVDASLQQVVCNGPQGDAGEPGPQGPQGPAGTIDPTQVILNQTAVVQGASFRIDGGAELGGQLTLLNPRALDTDPSSEIFKVRSPTMNRDAFVIRDDGAFVANGFARDVGNTSGCAPLLPATDAGTRFMWNPCRGSVRFGRVPAGPTTNGNWDDANQDDYTFAGGNNVVASGYGAFSYGDQVTVSSTVGVGFGSGVLVSGTAGFSAGASNRCTGFACTAIGYTTTASGQGSVALGYRTTADADYTVAIGYRASANGHTGAIVFADASTTDSVEASANNQFSLRAAGGVRLFTNATETTGVTLAAGGSSWNVVSDRNAKTGFQDVDGEELLRKLSALPVQTWVYKEEDRQPRHIGPMAQDFRAAFGLGQDDVTINTLDLDGLNLAAAKALEKRTAELDARTKEVAQLKGQVERLQQRLERLERAVAKDGPRKP